jgi:glutathione synthase/RimK-type ligase-like ATP-grasp enzyme
MEKDPKRNNFNSMLKLLKRYGEKEREIMVKIRNAVGHDHYGFDITQLECTDKETKNVPNIALLMQITMEKKRKKREM